MPFTPTPSRSTVGVPATLSDYNTFMQHGILLQKILVQKKKHIKYVQQIPMESQGNNMYETANL